MGQRAKGSPEGSRQELSVQSKVADQHHRGPGKRNSGGNKKETKEIYAEGSL